MSIEQHLQDLTAAIKEQTAFLKGLGKGGAAAGAAGGKPATKPAATKPKAPTIETVQERFGAYLGVEDKAERKRRIEAVKPIVAYFGVERISQVEASQYAEALGYLDELEAGNEPSLPESEDAGDGALV